LVNVRFVDRIDELRSLRELALRGSHIPIYLYGPEGCGKTRLLREFIGRFSDINAIYIDALEERDVGRAVMGTGFGDLIKISLELLEGLGAYSGIGGVIARNIALLISKLASRTILKGKGLVVFIDDAVRSRAIGLEGCEYYIKYLQNLIDKLIDELGLKSVTMVVTTSEGESLDLISRHTYATPILLWNLPYEGFIELMEQLSPPSAGVVDELWYLTSGNPRSLLEVAEVYRWDINLWIKSLEAKLLPITTKIGRDRLVRVTEDIDTLIYEHEVRKELIRHNLVTYIAYPTITLKKLKENRELGIGKYYAWQLPAYRQVIQKLIKSFNSII